VLLEKISQISVEDLYKSIQEPNDFFLVDVRNEDEFDAWKIEGRYTPETINIPYFEFLENEAESIARVPRDRSIIVLCAKGGASDYIAAMLQKEGIFATNVAEGMIGWGNLLKTRPVVEKSSYAIYQIDRVARGCLSHILLSGDRAVIIDPLRFTEPYLEFLSERNANLEFILDTHGHADHISGGSVLSKATGSPYYLHPYDGIHPFDMLPARLDYHMLHHNQEFQFGDLSIRVLHVPGHTLGQVNFLVTGGDGDNFLFSGDNLFIQSFGRPDLGGQGTVWAPLVYETIHTIIKNNVPANALVLPGHYASPHEAGENGLFGVPLSELWLENHDLAEHSQEDDFIRFVLDHLPQMPEQYVQIKRVNAGLVQPDEDEASELELGKNICALSTAY
jgi:glyoxylase-like metal-dependent hydrolase (beta-lactamase superfamily II)/rhodanese-related sulfurtransferase